MGKRLLVLAGPDEGRVFVIPPADSVLLGRSRATETCLIDPHVSRVHCQVQIESGEVTVTDFDSPGGTWVNGKRVAKYALQPGDLLRIGGTRLQYLDDEAESPLLTEPALAALTQPPALVPAPAGGCAGGGRPGATKVATRTKVAKKPFVWPHDLVGRTLGNHKVGAVLARSKRGYIFHARDLRKNLPVALKVFEPAFAKDAKAVERFVKAMKIILRLRHPHLVTVQGAGKTGPFCWLAMEYVSGESLAAVIGRIEASGPLDWRHILRFAIYIGRALTFAHGKGLIHRNITPHNILLGGKPQETKLADLMLATALEGDQPLPLSARGTVVGDIPFMAPEITAGGSVPVDARADLYSLGAVLYAMCAGRPPFAGETVTELVTKVRREEPAPVNDLHPALSDRLARIIHRLLAKGPADRYPSAKELLADVESLARQEEVAL